jgi:hypothetical protein
VEAGSIRYISLASTAAVILLVETAAFTGGGAGPQRTLEATRAQRILLGVEMFPMHRLAIHMVNGDANVGVAATAIKWVGGLMLAVAVGCWSWLMVPWTSQDCWQVIARADGLHDEEYAVAQRYKGFFGDLYSVNFYYRPGHEGPWTGYWLAYDDPYWRRVEILVDPISGQVTIRHGGDAVGVFNRGSGTFNHHLHRNPSIPQVEVENPQTCPAD